MPRRRRLRRIVAPPGFAGYKPYGNQIKQKEPVELFYEEYEALKLADYDFMNHLEAAKIMGVSRATFARIYESARRKIAQTFVEIREVKAVFGNATLDKSWFICNNCSARFTIPPMHRSHICPMCKSKTIDFVK